MKFKVGDKVQVTLPGCFLTTHKDGIHTITSVGKLGSLMPYGISYDDSHYNFSYNELELVEAAPGEEEEEDDGQDFKHDWKNAKYNRFAIKRLLDERDELKADRDRLHKAASDFLDARYGLVPTKLGEAACLEILREALANRSPKPLEESES